jgi:hypothetical protein
MDRLFIGIYPCGLVYADRKHEVAGDYALLAFLPYASLVPDFTKRCSSKHPLRAEIAAHMDSMIAKRGEDFQVSTAGQTVRLGGAAS